MQILQQLAQVHTTGDMLLAALVTIACAYAIGYLLDRIFTGLGFGVLGNMCLVLLSIVIAISVAPHQTLILSGDDAVRISVLASAITTGLLLIFGALKSYVIHHRR